jgi:hypothetical protein
MAQSNPTRSRSALVLALLAPLVSLAGVAVYYAFVGVPFVRASALPAWIGLGLGLGASWIALRSRRAWWTRVSFGVSLMLALLFSVVFTFLLRVPRDAQALAFETAPDFTLPDHMGRPIHLQAELERGPILLVFYRGHW